jgi:predicted regulator of Ras-like GTPase activity (Roadblock/LC7/MglB family)
MDAGQALAELTEISSQIELAVVFDSRGELIGSTLAERDVAEALVRGGSELFATASKAGGEEHGEAAQVELALSEASILLVREGDLRILAVTQPDPVVGLVFFDLGTCLRKVAGAEPKKRRLRVLRSEAKNPPPTGEDNGAAA